MYQKKVISRVPPAVDEMRALDGALWWSLGFGLEMYMGTGQPNGPGKPMVSYRGQRRPFFKATSDEEAVAYRGLNRVFFAPPHLRGFPCRDFCHKYHRVALNSLHHAGFMGDIAVLIFLFDVNRHPYLTADFGMQKREVLQTLAKVVGPMFSYILYEHVTRSRQILHVTYRQACLWGSCTHSVPLPCFWDPGTG